MENERADAGRDGQTRLAEPNLDTNGEGGNPFACSADHEQDWQQCPVDPYYAESADHTVHTCTRIGGK